MQHTLHFLVQQLLHALLAWSIARQCVRARRRARQNRHRVEREP